MKNIKKGFTLFELIIVIIIFSIAIGFISIKTDLFLRSGNQNTFFNIKKTLLSYDFEKTISLKCTLEEDCFLFIDDTLQEEKLSIDIKDDIEVYNYDTTFSEITFKDVEPKELQRYNIVFELTINKDKKHNDMIVLNDEKVYIFNSIYKMPLELDSLSEVSDYFEELKNEVKDSAF